MGQLKEKVRTSWLPGFYGGIELELKEYADSLSFEPEHCLSKEPIRMDMLLIKKEQAIVINNPIGEIFLRYNVIEYKSPQCSISIDSFYKTVGYACLYKGLGKFKGEISEKELTISIFRHSYPRKLFADLRKAGAVITNAHEGVYRVTGIINIPTQIVVMKQLKSGEHSALKILTKNADVSEIRNFSNMTAGLGTPAEKNNADAVLQVSMSSNETLFRELRNCKKINYTKSLAFFSDSTPPKSPS